MAFSDDLDTDRDNVFLNTVEYAEVVAYRVASTGVSSNVTAVFQDAGDNVLSDGSQFHISEGEVAAPVKGDEITRSGKIYHITFVTEEEGVFFCDFEREEIVT